jgi:transcriptional regulator of acetoin/glycerol metabolism
LDADDFELSDARPPARQTPAVEVSSAVDSGRKVASLEAHKADERDRILQALQAASWNRVKAAKLVGLPRRTFYRRLKEYGIQ